MASFSDIGEVVGDPAAMAVYEHGWQSWSPAGLYPATARSPRPRRRAWQTMAFRPEQPAPPDGFQAEGLLAVVDADRGVRSFIAPAPHRSVPTIRARLTADRLVISTDGEVEELPVADTLAAALDGAAAHLVNATGAGAVDAHPPAWCSWYCYWGEVTEDDIVRELAAMERLRLPIATVQIDDGHQAEIGDWLARSPRFGPLDLLARRIADTGREAGIWTAPFLVGARSALAREHPEWLVDGAVAAPEHWGQEVRVLDVTHPEAAEHLHSVFATLRRQGYRYHKIDFLYAGAMTGGRYSDAAPLDAYGEGLRIIREAIGSDALLLGCGAPLLPSIGRVDAMRVAPDIDPKVEPADGDISQPSQRGALASGRARAWMHGRLWANDPDCILVRPEVRERERWAAHLDAYNALMVSSDPLDALDERGLELARTLLRPSGTTPPVWDPHAGADQGALRPAARRGGPAQEDAT